MTQVPRAHPKIGLALSGGGARGAYQAGVLLGISELSPAGAPSPFQIITGASAGALNAAFLAARADDYALASRELAELWTGLRTSHVFRTDFWTLVGQGLRVFRNIVGGGGVLHSDRRNHLLVTTPLYRMIRERVDFARATRLVNEGRLGALAVTTTHYLTGSSVTHFESSLPVREWDKGNHVSLRTEIGPEHVLASSAIPVFFPPVRVEGSYHGDGSVRLTSPLRPAIHLGAERILAISVRRQAPSEPVREANQAVSRTISLAEIVGVMLNAVFLDSMDQDLERMERINRTLSLLSEEARAKQPDFLRTIPVKLIRPSRDLGALASKHIERLPRTLRYLLRGLGTRQGRGSDILSYLTFESEYCRELIELGRADVAAQRAELTDFFGF
ncbi:MAG: patatin-like phospholipase family protein [Bdellovibrionales bacterium]|nr:patatin-like phospholipase family protein [Bdellovibrionales bacterium]